MHKKQTHFEQVPLDTIKKIIDEDIRQQSQRKTPAKANAERLEEALLLEGAAVPSGGR
jgi:hypothetical protein